MINTNFSRIDEQLGRMLTQVLAIPLADSLPTPNARKTCALSIWLLQVQRFPDNVLLPASDRIAYAVRRGLDGELGKEGKKGSGSDGLKVIPVYRLDRYVLSLPLRLFMTSQSAILKYLSPLLPLFSLQYSSYYWVPLSAFAPSLAML